MLNYEDCLKYFSNGPFIPFTVRCRQCSKISGQILFAWLWHFEFVLKENEKKLRQFSTLKCDLQIYFTHKHKRSQNSHCSESLILFSQVYSSSKTNKYCQGHTLLAGKMSPLCLARLLFCTSSLTCVPTSAVFLVTWLRCFCLSAQQWHTRCWMISFILHFPWMHMEYIFHIQYLAHS